MSTDGYFIGLMSGTSMDGIDAALVQIKQDSFRLIHSLSHSWPAELTSRLAAATGDNPVDLRELGQLDVLCGELFAGATRHLLTEAEMAATRITAIGSHGQTLFHHPHPPAPFSMQIGDPNTLAERTGITVVADFRRRDMAAGGQGAPLVPAFHQALFRHARRNRVILNIGGIANITVLPAAGDVTGGFDTGPGNCLMDRWIQHHQGLCFDEGGRWAASGQVIEPLLQHFLNDAYFSLNPPKSTGTEYFSESWLRKKLQGFPTAAPEDIQATLLQLTCQSIARAILRWAEDTQEVLVCGGGSHNARLMDDLSQQMRDIPVQPTSRNEKPVDPDWVEAMAFAWLARQTLQHKPGNIPDVTGACRPVVLGGIYPAA
ncbi:anhydro-N-acetylmuramic acid kinase [Thiolapillus sp.]|uniref:anhydro-N-acetylmuramic acid kinase n=1 Tax=Thiolapillus sp. TaxID=2017437 RepID=UPI003AF846BE